MYIYEVRPHNDHRGVDLISDVLPFGHLCYGEPNAISNAISYAKFFSRSHGAVIRVYDAAGNVIETHEHAGDFNRSPYLLFGADYFGTGEAASFWKRGSFRSGSNIGLSRSSAASVRRRNSADSFQFTGKDTPDQILEVRIITERV